MLKFWSTNRHALFAFTLFSALFGLSRVTHAAGPITNLTVDFATSSLSVGFTAGVTTNTLNTVIFINTFGTGFTTPDAGETVSLELLDSGVVVPNGMTPTSLTTTGTGVVNGGNSPFPIRLFRAGTNLQIRARSATNGATDPTPTLFSVNVGSATKLLPLGPGMTHAPGTNPLLTTGYSGGFTPQEPNVPFTVRVLLTDAQYNLVSAGHTVSFPPVDMVTLPAPTAMTAGTAQVFVAMSGARTDRTLTVVDDTDGTVANGTLAMTTAGPPAKEVYPFPSPFNPHLGNMTFRYRLSEPQSVKLTVTDLYGQHIWENSAGGNTGFNDVTWNGRNDKGTVVAAGVYYVLLEVNGSLESKKRFGVTK